MKQLPVRKNVSAISTSRLLIGLVESTTVGQHQTIVSLKIGNQMELQVHGLPTN